MIFSKTKTLRLAAFLALSILFIITGVELHAQETADKVIVVVGRGRIILQSDLERAVMEAKQQNPEFGEEDKCALLLQMILSKTLLDQAERDSVSVTDEDVEGQLENRIRYFMQLYGSKERMEQMSGKTVYQIKEEFRDNIREQMVVEKMQAQILEHTKITPAEIADFYRKIPVDSLPFFPATVEVGQIVVNPPVSQELDEYAHNKLEGIRKEIVEGGKSFEIMAISNTDDPGSRDNGGRYESVKRDGGWAPEFLSAAFKLQNGEVSPIFKTHFGYHIIQMINRKGDEADLRHILIKPELTSADFKIALRKLDSIKLLLESGKMTFPEAVGKFSDDEAAKRTGGMINDPNTGATTLDITKLDPGMVLLLDSLLPGEYSKSHIYINEMRDQSCRIVFLRSRTAPHKANLKDDYNKIQDVAFAQKKNKKLQTWVKENMHTFYLKIDPQYSNCTGIKELLDSIKLSNNQ